MVCCLVLFVGGLKSLSRHVHSRNVSAMYLLTILNPVPLIGHQRVDLDFLDLHLLCCRPGSGFGPGGLWEPRLLLDLHL